MKAKRKRDSVETRIRLCVLSALTLSGFTVGAVMAETPADQPQAAPAVQTVSGDIHSDVMAVGHSFVPLPFPVSPKVVGTGHLSVSGTMKDMDDKVRKLDSNNSYVYENNKTVFTPELRERHHLLAAMAKGELDLNGDDTSSYNVDAVVAISGGKVNITGKDLTTNLLYMTTPLKSSKYYQPGNEGEMHIKLSGDLILHNDDWDKYPRMDGFHYHHSSNLYSRGGISVNGADTLTIEANKVEGRYLRNSDFHHGDGKGSVTITANEFVLNKMGRSSYLDDGKKDEQWVVGKTEDDKGGMFQFYNGTVTINAKDVKIGGVYPGMQARKEASEDRIDIDAGNRATINIKSPQMENFYLDGEMRAIDGSTIDVQAQNKVRAGSAFAGYTSNYKYGYWADNGKYKEGIYYYKGIGDDPNSDPSTIHVKGNDIEFVVAHQAEEGGYNHIGFGYIGAGQNGHLLVEANKNLTIKNGWNGFEGHGPGTRILYVAQGGQAAFHGENVSVEGSIILGGLSKEYDKPKAGGGYDDVYFDPLDYTPGQITIQGHGKDVGSMQLKGSVDGETSNLTISDFKTVDTGVFLGFQQGQLDSDNVTIGSKVDIHNVGTVTMDATNPIYQAEHDGNVYDKKAGTGYVLMYASSRDEKHKNNLSISADAIRAKGILAFEGLGATLNLKARDIDLYRLYVAGYDSDSEAPAKAKIEADTLRLDTDLVSDAGELTIKAKNFTIAGDPYYVDTTHPQYTDTGRLISQGKPAFLSVINDGKADISIGDDGTFTAGIDSKGDTTLSLGKHSLWTKLGESTVQTLVNHGLVDAVAKGSKLTVSTAYSGDGMIRVPERTMEQGSVVKLAALSEENTNLHFNAVLDAPDVKKEYKIPLVDLGSKENLKSYDVLVTAAKPELVTYKGTIDVYDANKDKTTLDALNGEGTLVLSKVSEAGPSASALEAQSVLDSVATTFFGEMNPLQGGRLDDLRSGKGHGLWAHLGREQVNVGDYGWQANDMAVGVDGQRQHGEGMVYGGMSVGHRTGHSNGLVGQPNISQTAIGLYGGYRGPKGLFVDGQLSYGNSSYDAQLAEGSLSLSGGLLSSAVRHGKDYTQGVTTVSPFMGLQYNQWKLGSSAVNSLAYGDVQAKATIYNAGLSFTRAQGQSKVYGGLVFNHRLSGDTSASMGDTRRQVSMNAVLPTNWWTMSLGSSLNINKRAQLNLDLSKTFGDDIHSTMKGSVDLQIRY